MMDKFDAYREQIDAYVHGRMEEAQRLKFEQVLAAQPELKEEVETLISYRQSFQRKDLIDFQSTLEQVARAHTQSTSGAAATKVKKLRTPYLLLAAAAVITFLVAVVLVWNRPPQQTYVEYAQVELPFPIERSSIRGDELDAVDSIYFSLESRLNTADIERSELASLIELIGEAGHKKAYQSRYQQANEMLLARAYLLYGNPTQTLHILDQNWPSDQSTCAINYYRAVALLELASKKEAENVLAKLDCPDIQTKVEELLEIAQHEQE